MKDWFRGIPMKDMIRSFVAIAIEPQVQKEIGRIQEELKKKIQNIDARVSWVKPETIHLTLKFLGDIRVNQVGPILASLQKALEGVKAFSLKIEGLGVFPNLKNPRVVWIGIAGESLPVVQPRVEQALAAVGFPREKKKFRPHLTLGRIRSVAQVAALSESLAAISSPVAGQSIVQDIRLMKSELRPTGAIHTQLGRIPLV